MNDEQRAATEDAVYEAQRNYGESIDIGALIEALEARGWVWQG